MLDKQYIETLRKENPFLSLRDVVYNVLLQEIVSFRLAPGRRINESTVAEALGVSRSPLKNALARLWHNSYVVRQPGYRLVAFSWEEYRDIAELTGLIEPYAASRAAVRMNLAEFEQLHELARQLHDICRGGKPEHAPAIYAEIADLEYQFHSLIVRLAWHQMLEEFYEHIKFKIFRYRSYLNYDPPDDYFRIVGEEHLRICEIFNMHDPVMAEAIMRRHLALARSKFEQKFAGNATLDLDQENVADE